METSNQWSAPGKCGPFLFINDIPDIIYHIIKLFAYDSKIIGVIKNNRDLELMQKDHAVVS
jgi:hypothetical protein